MAPGSRIPLISGEYLQDIYDFRVGYYGKAPGILLREPGIVSDYQLWQVLVGFQENLVLELAGSGPGGALTSPQATSIANKLGYVTQSGNKLCHGQKVHYNKKKSKNMQCITQDCDTHSGRAWKIGTISWCEGGCRGQRTGTYELDAVTFIKP
ncbi:unnamed protein product [Adineta ricciae]|uniref:Novel toxin 21 domain-containing protein n=1 Tax=Adineta ricciae TaxID=249248 RepID=A0A815QFD7_ADIRI|nr:unnamed protein product [Adineta ricciae]